MRGHACDVTSERAVSALIDQVLAGLSVQQLRACLEVNVVGTWLACRAAAAPCGPPGTAAS